MSGTGATTSTPPAAQTAQTRTRTGASRADAATSRSAPAAEDRLRRRERGGREPLPPDIDMAAYRIVQEAVTTVVRHAAPDSCRVPIDRTGDAVAVEVSDGGRGTAGALAGGYGLTGMRERVELLHGEFSAGPLPGGGFRVAARLPVPVGAA